MTLTRARRISITFCCPPGPRIVCELYAPIERASECTSSRMSTPPRKRSRLPSTSYDIVSGEMMMCVFSCRCRVVDTSGFFWL